MKGLKYYTILSEMYHVHRELELNEEAKMEYFTFELFINRQSSRSSRDIRRHIFCIRGHFL